MLSQSVESPHVVARDASKRKRVNRTAKLKQNKLDARREQWLSQGKQPNTSPKSCGVDYEFLLHGGGGDSDNESCVINQDDLCDGQVAIKGSSNSEFLQGTSPVQVPLVMNPDFEKQQQQHQNTKEPQPVKRKSGRVKCKLDSLDDTGSLVGDSSKQDQQQEQGHVEDDWEAAADALNCQMNLNKESEKASSDDDSRKKLSLPVARTSAWKPDDASRPASLPKPGAYFGDGILPLPSTPPITSTSSTSGWIKRELPKKEHISIVAIYCPICTEELDSTDSSFLPCPCGFRLCLFCHHRIAAEDGRCPGCRKCYNQNKGSTAALAV